MGHTHHQTSFLRHTLSPHQTPIPTTNKHQSKWTLLKPPSRTSCPSLVNTTPPFTRRSLLLSSTRPLRGRSTRSTSLPSTRRFTRTTTTPPSSLCSTRRSSPSSTTTTSSPSSTAATTRLRLALQRSVPSTVTPSRESRVPPPATSHPLLLASTSTTTSTRPFSL